MFKRFFILALCAVLLCALIPVQSQAATDQEVERICKQISTIYRQTLRSSGFASLQGYCGTMAGWELYYLGVTDIPITQNGNQMYDILKVSQHVNPGFSVDCYPATGYSLEEALNAVTNGGTVDAYNIMVGFHWTTTAAGRKYGHVMVIHAILDGLVYFTEGFVTPFQSDPSKPMICTIEEFAQYYNRWTRFEGLIHFGSTDRIRGCDTYGSNLIVAAQSQTPLYRLPATQDSPVLRTVAAGERLHVSAVCENGDGQRFYQIQDGALTGFVATDVMTPVEFLYDDITLTDPVIPTQLEDGKSFTVSGVIRSRNMIHTLVVQVQDQTGQAIMACELERNSLMSDLGTSIVNDAMMFSKLETGSYTYKVYCDMVNHYDDGTMILGNMERVEVISGDFTVGDAQLMVSEAVETRANTAPEGWQYADGAWYFYRDGQPVTGWLCQDGVDYYLLDDGKAATGWQTVNGKARYFTATGAMCTGWLQLDDTLFYLLRNGVPATGPVNIDGTMCLFSPEGVFLPRLNTQAETQ